MDLSGDRCDEPIVRVVAHAQDFEQTLAVVTDHFLRHPRGAAVIELSTDVLEQAHLEETFRRWMARIAPQMRQRARGVALVVPGWWMAWLVRFELWGEPIGLPTTVVRSTEQALLWARAQLA